jgi:pimeloyl-ACP methyl ester carboxylesterase
MVTDTDVTVRGCKVHVRRAGSGEPLLFLHGVQGLAGWDRGLEELAQHFDVIAPDHPGFGLSGNADRVDDVSDLAFFYLDLLEALDLDGVHVVGQCLGGWLAMEIAIRSTKRIKTLTLVNSAGIRIKGTPRADMFICPPDELMQLLFAGNGGAAWLEQWKTKPELEDAYERNTAAAAKFTWQPRLCSLKLDRWLHRIDVPTHIVWGDGDKVIPPAYGAALQTLIPGATLATLPACGHLAHAEQPQALARQIVQFAGRAAA